MTTIWQDIEYAFKTLRKNPGFAVVAVMVMALGIGINTTAFSVINAVLFRPLPVKQPDSLFSMSIHTREQVYDDTFSYPDLEFLRDNADVFEGVLTFRKMSLPWQRHHTRKVTGEWVSRDYFNILGVKTSLGRFFSLEEQSVPNAYPVAILSHAFWRSEFDGSEDILGTDIIINNKNYTIVGVVESGFEGLRPSRPPDLWLPMMMAEQFSGDALTRSTNYEVIGRLRKGTSQRNAETQLTALLPELEKNFSHFNGKRGQGRVLLTPCGYGSLATKERGGAWIASVIFLSVTGMVLLIACANMANLLLARALARRREIATRLALGAGRVDLIRQLLCESLLLALMGGCIGLWLADSATKIFMSVRPANISLPPDIGLDIRVIIFTFFLSLLTTLMFGLIPALQGTRVAISQALKEKQGIFSGDIKRFSTRNILIAGQIMICVILLMSAGLLLQSVRQTMNIEFGFDSRNTLLLQLPNTLYGQNDVDPLSVYEQVIGQVQTLPGVEAASLVDMPQLGGGCLTTSVATPGTENKQQAMTYVVGPDYFKTLRIDVKQGREFSRRDRVDQMKVAVINETLARLLWPGEYAVGRTIDGGEKPHEICGVVRDSKYNDARETPQPAVYYCSLQSRSAQVLIVRTKGNPAMFQRALEAKIQELDPSMPRPQAKTYTRQIQGMLIGQRAVSLFVMIIGAGGLLLAGIGLYGIASYTGRLRTNEIGLRIALGARWFDIVLLIVRQAVGIIIVGLATGFLLTLPIALFLSKVIPFGMSIFDPATFVIVPLVMLITVSLACLIPALRAAKVDPMEALRCE